MLADLREKKMLSPGAGFEGSPVDLQGLRFPTLPVCETFGVEPELARRVCGRQEIRDATLDRVDLKGADLSSCIWDGCTFDKVSFDQSQLGGGRFLGCVFEQCSFQGTNLKNTDFNLSWGGRETEISNTVFDGADFRGASFHNLRCRKSAFLRCKLGPLVFDAPMFQEVVFSGMYKALAFRGMPGEPERNRLGITLADAAITWLEADNGLDLSLIVLPSNGSCAVLRERIHAVEQLAVRLPEVCGPVARVTAATLKRLYSDERASPLSPDQTFFMISKGMLNECDKALSPEDVERVFIAIKSIAGDSGYLVSPLATGSTASAV